MFRAVVDELAHARNDGFKHTSARRKSALALPVYLCPHGPPCVQAEMEDEETQKIEGMVAPKPSFVPRRMQLGGEAPPGSGAASAPAGAPPQTAKKVEVVYTPASDALLEVCMGTAWCRRVGWWCGWYGGFGRVG